MCIRDRYIADGRYLVFVTVQVFNSRTGRLIDGYQFPVLIDSVKGRSALQNGICRSICASYVRHAGKCSDPAVLRSDLRRVTSIQIHCHQTGSVSGIQDSVHPVIRIIKSHFHNLTVGFSDLPIGPCVRIHLIQISVAVVAVIEAVHVFPCINKFQDLSCLLVFDGVGRIKTDDAVAGAIMPVIQQIPIKILWFFDDLYLAPVSYTHL